MKRIVNQAAAPDTSFADALIAWQKQHGRHQLPWQRTRDAYRIWLSEIMLQQTQVTTVIPYYARFLDSFPTVAALAAAPTETVMAHWSGLGYYTRARNLHRCAQQIVAHHAGRFPSDPETLVSLPGIGKSTAAAIAAFAFGSRAAILDGNVKRVFCRVFGIEGFPGQAAVEKHLWQRAEALLPARDIEAYTQGLMDLGATLCTRTRPACERCPMQSRCIAHASARTAELPARKPKKAIPQKSTVMLVVMHEGEILMEQRPPEGIWGGLLSLPELNRLSVASQDDDLHEQLALVLSSFGDIESVETLRGFVHGFTHYRLMVTPVQVRLRQRHAMLAQSDYQWRALAQISEAALPSPVRKLLGTLSDSVFQPL
ncbi:MAG: A/G-specific adenine glycosylase [Oxalobacteraceae bacterium]|nr:A/G-specific adenine glycosylase [Oxalobacteraceae bacterium]